MKIKDVQIEGFGVWSGLSVDSLPDGMTVFYGPNEAGKTTLMQFLRAMFYGFTPERRNRYLPPVFGGRPGGAMRVTGPGGGYELARRAQLNDPGVVGQLTVTSGDGLVQGQHRLAMLLGQVDETIFTNVFAIGLRELQELSTLDDTAAADELYKLSSGLDRVSLVDVMRQLRAARSQIVGGTPEQGQMQGMILRREKLRDEQDQLIARGKRWGELAAQRKSYQGEVEELDQRCEQWELESKLVETAIQVRDPWNQRLQWKNKLGQLSARVDLPDDAGNKLRSLHAALEERKQKLQEVRDQRRAIRTRAQQLPVRKNILAMSSKIEAASEQGPWISALQKQIHRLTSEVQQSREQLIEDARRLGLSEEDQHSLMNDKRMANLPDLSRQAITQLAGPARDVRTQSVRLKQLKVQGENDKKEADRLATEIKEYLDTQSESDLHEAMQRRSDLLEKLRNLQLIQDRLDKLHHQRKELDEDAIDLASEDAIPMEKVFIMGIPFILGGVALIIGMMKMIGRFWFVADFANGMILTLVGIFILMLWWNWKNLSERGTDVDLDDCEGQIEALVRQIRKTEQELAELERSLPDHNGTIEQQIREIEHEYTQLESLLPSHQNHQAAVQRYQTARKRASATSDALKVARSQWQKTLLQLGLAESLSPKSIRIMAEGYESLSQTRRRLKTQEDELDQRKLELASLHQRIDSLARQVATTKDADGQTRKEAKRNDREPRAQDELKHRDTSRKSSEERLALVRSDVVRSDVVSSHDAVDGSVSRLQDLTLMLSEQQQYIQQRRTLKDEDSVLSKQQKAIQRAMDKLVLSRQSLLADLGVENQQQLDEHLELKKEHFQLQEKIEDLDGRIRAMIGGQASHDAVTRLLEGPGAGELEKRWSSLQERVQQAKQRISQLHQRQGETSQEMKTLAADRRLSEVKLELACVEKQLQSCAAHWQTLAATTHMLEKVCEVYETERQPETLREASTFLKQLTDGKYVRVWTPLGKNALRIDNQQGQSLPLEVLSRGTREAVFIALRLSLAAAYARRGVTLPLVMDDVLVNFDTLRAKHAAAVLRDFADLGNQVIMFTCHEHIMRMFHEIGVQVRVLPTQGQPGEARPYVPEFVALPEPTVYLDTYTVDPLPEPVAAIHVEQVKSTIVPEPVLEEKVYFEEVPEPVYEPEPEPAVTEPERIEVPVRTTRKPRAQPRPTFRPAPPTRQPDPIPSIDHLWYELDPTAEVWTEYDDRLTVPTLPSSANERWWEDDEGITAR